ncbi:MAG: tetratricopeptide repeat protein [Planctomycetales bacterium]|nr:tetratricopeptide repeat protein [Planctomycetales bacterium]
MNRTTQAHEIESLRRIEEVCTRFENADPNQRDIEAFAEGFTGDERGALIEELVALDAELRQQDREPSGFSGSSKFTEQNQSLLGAVPSGFLNTNFQNLLDLDKKAEPSSPRYHIGPSIGVGGIGEVYRVFDTFGQRSLALKTIHRRFLSDESAISRFRREGLLTGTLQHPGIPPVYDHGTLDDGTPYFSMKLVEGQTFQEIIKSRGTGADQLGHLIDIFENVVQTIAYAHSQNVVHRDLKPHNIMVGQFGEVQVMDWGLAKRLGDDSVCGNASPSPSTVGTNNGSIAVRITDGASPVDSDVANGMTPHDSDLTTAGDIVGTPGYMSPEQARGEINSVDTRADVFALGAILFQILFGRLPFQHDSRIEVIEKTKQGNLATARKMLDERQEDPELVALCRHCLDPVAANRPADAAAVAEVIGEYLTGMERRLRQAEIERSQSEVRSVESRKRQRWIIGLTSALAAVAIASSIVVSFQWRKAEKAAVAESIARDDAEKDAAATNEINQFLNEILSSGLPERSGPNVTLREVIDQALPDIDGKFSQRPRVEGTIRRTLGESYRWLGEQEKSETQFRLALEAFEKSPSVDELEILETKDRLAGVLRSRGDDADLAESKQLRTEVLMRTRELCGDADPLTIIAMNNLGTVLIELNELDAAQKLFRDALAQLDSIPDTVPSERTPLIINIADIDRIQGKWDAAEATYLKLINDPDTTIRDRETALVQLGEMLYWAERYDASIRYLQEAVRVREEFYGALNRLTLSAMRKLSRALNAAGRYEEQIPLLEDSLARHTEAEWVAATSVCEARSLMANALIGLGREQEAVQYMRETLELIHRERGVDHDYAVKVQEQLDNFLARDMPGNSQEAENPQKVENSQ